MAEKPWKVIQDEDGMWWVEMEYETELGCQDTESCNMPGETYARRVASLFNRLRKQEVAW